MASGGFSFGAPTTTTGASFSFGFPTAGATTNPTQPTAASNLFSPAATTLGQPSLGFGLQPKTTGISLFGQTTTTTSTSGFGSPGAFGFGLKTPTSNPTSTTSSAVSTPGFGFGLSASKPNAVTTSAPSSFGLGATTTASIGASPFSFGLPSTPASTTTGQSGSINFGITPSTASASAPQTTTSIQSPFTLGSSLNTGTKPFGALPSFGLSTSATTSSSQPAVQATAGSTQSPLHSSLKLPTTSVPFGTPSGPIGIPNSTTNTPLQIGLRATTSQPSLPGFGTPSTTNSASTATTTLGISAPSTSTGFGLSTSLFKNTTTPAATTSTGPVGLGLATSSLASTTAQGTTSTSTAAVTTSAAQTTAAASKTTTLTYNQLEDLINKWACELEDQERYFLDEADRITQWDQALINNGEKITTLYEKVESCKAEQVQIEKELDLIENQQKELENLLEPLERAANELPPGQLHSDFEREAIFQLATNVDLELGQLLSDLREMADQVNSSTSRLGLSVDSSASESALKDGGSKLIKSFKQSGDSSDTVQQLTRILNCHMHSLNWIHLNSQELMERLKSLDASQAP